MAAERDLSGLADHLEAWRCQRQDLQVDVAGIHVGQPHVIKIAQAPHEVRRPSARAVHVKTHQTLEQRLPDSWPGTLVPTKRIALPRIQALLHRLARQMAQAPLSLDTDLTTS